MGKREIAQLTYFDYVAGITIGSIAANMAFDTSMNFGYVLISLVVFAAFQIFDSYMSYRNEGFRHLVDGEPAILIEKGKILEDNLKKCRLNIDELNTMLRANKVFTLEDVDYAILETSGRLSVLNKSEKLPLRPYDVGMTGHSNGVGVLVIEEGKLLNERLSMRGITKAWLMEKISEQGITDISQIAFAQVDGTGNVYIDMYSAYEEKKKKSSTDDMLLATFQKIHADFLTFASDTGMNDVKQVYKNCANKIQTIENTLRNAMNKQDDMNGILNR
jgi:uncharacterized membrane protein YcaP (DUF421 family)